jgi:hypothetical protein
MQEENEVPEENIKADQLPLKVKIDLRVRANLDKI